jgi:hypothetical protein
MSGDSYPISLALPEYQDCLIAQRTPLLHSWQHALAETGRYDSHRQPSWEKNKEQQAYPGTVHCGGIVVGELIADDHVVIT